MRTRFLSLFILLLLSTANQISGQETIVQGQVHNWPSDTVYFCELPFHSPYTYSLHRQVFKKDSTFHFEIKNQEKAFTAFIAPTKKVVDRQLDALLFNNLTDQHYWGHCIRIYTHGTSTFLIEPNKGLDIDLTYSSWPEKVSPQMYERMKSLGATVVGDDKILQIGRINVLFNNANRAMHEYYQSSFNLDNQCDMALSRKSSSINVNFAITNLKNTKRKLLAELDKKRKDLNPVFYDYLFAEIEFGAKKEFLKYLKYEKQDYLKEMIASGKIPEEIVEVIAFDHSILTESMLINEEYIEYIEFYLNFVMSMANMEYVEYHPFSMEKMIVASEELAEISMYYYLANQFLYAEPTEEFSAFCSSLIAKFPDGELNDKLRIKYDL